MRDSCAREVRWFDTYLGGVQIAHRDLIATTPLGLPAMNWIHCEMEEGLLRRASEAGAEVRRGAHVAMVQPGKPPTVSVADGSRITDLRARLVVGADGRSSNVRKWANFEVQRGDYGLLVAGVLLQMPEIERDTNYFVLNSSNCSGVFIAPQSQGRTRAYVGIPKGSSYRYQSLADLSLFVEDSIAAGAPARWYSEIQPIEPGPLATSDGADTWVAHPYKNGVVLVGDAASSSDPTYGQGQALSLRDARVLRDHLIASTDWDAAAHALCRRS
jgi:2-polyprenyl-6-methoxyphenol hydroxylase-like FAD-dependent oxidoreductase